MPAQDIRIKFCGITRRKDIELAAELGADYFGTVIEIDRSTRKLERTVAAQLHRDAPLPGVALVQDYPADEILAVAEVIQPSAMQLQGREPVAVVEQIRLKLDCEIWKALHVPVKGAATSDSDAESVDVAAIAQEVRRFTDAGVDKFLVDTIDVSEGFARMGGTGKVGDWSAAAKVVELTDAPVFLAGGIKPGNVADAIRQVRPFGVDLAGGIEASPGIKDPSKMRRLIENARSA